MAEVPGLVTATGKRKNAIARVLLMSDDAHTESLCVHLTPGGHTAIADLCLSKSVERGIMLRITRTSL